MRCAYARLMQWGENPVIAECTLDGERWVASAGRSKCGRAKEAGHELPIEHIEI